MLSPEFIMNHMLGSNSPDISLPDHKHAPQGVVTKRARIRTYRKEDRHAVEKIIREAEDVLPLSQRLKHSVGSTIRYWLDHGFALASFYVLTVCSEIKGLAGVTPMEQTGFGEVCQLQPLYLHADMRGNGYGQQLLDHSINRARETGYLKCYVEVSEKLSEAIKLIEAYGFYKMPSAPVNYQGTDHTIRYYMKYIF
ncbi:MAG: GNAT family N-acetyltransferase [Cyclobacteriaceae bacterium]